MAVSVPLLTNSIYYHAKNITEMLFKVCMSGKHRIGCFF